MKKLTGGQIRALFIEYFQKHHHLKVDPVPLIPHDDPTLLWINSGVAGLKKYFDGTLVPPSKRLVNCQKAIRTNDIEIVGNSARHHTFFEMLGNFSIGGYFRDEAIRLGWHFLTDQEYLGINPDKLYFTYYPQDLETKKCWEDLGADPSHLIPCEGNFWEIGEGPCGPDTEIFFDRGSQYDPHNLGVKLIADDINNDRYVEIWNIVFSQYAAKEGVARADYPPLPQKNIDTGAGLERLACILQETETNFETDLFMPLIKAMEAKTGISYRTNKKAFFIIADHLRSVVMALSDGAAFSNEGRGYVLRRLLRRATRYLIKLGIDEPFLFQLAPIVADLMKDVYPDTATLLGSIQEMIKTEEVQFRKTISRGLNLLDSYLQNKVVSGADAFKLYDTYGFPVELTIEIAEENGISVDLDEYHQLMAKQQEMAKNARNKEQSMAIPNSELLALTVKSEFVYDVHTLTTKVNTVFQNGAELILLLDQTPFYAESGGQVCDSGTICNERFTGKVDRVEKAPHGQHLHYIKEYQGEIKSGDQVTATINEGARQQTACYHSATHLLQSALRSVLGPAVHQAGSYVSAERLRFDFTFPRKLTTEELRQIELLTNQMIFAGHEADIKTIPFDQAVAAGALMLPGEKYPNVVRLVRIGDCSKELCGGTHVKNSKDIGLLVIDSEAAIASGVRRIEAYVGADAYAYLETRRTKFQQITEYFKSGNNPLDDVIALNQKNKELAKALEKRERTYGALIVISAEQIARKDSVRILLVQGQDIPLNYLSEITRSISNTLYIITNPNQQIVITASKEAVACGLKAIDFLRAIVGNSGGGKDYQAQGKGSYTAAQIKEVVNALLSH